MLSGEQRPSRKNFIDTLKEIEVEGEDGKRRQGGRQDGPQMAEPCQTETDRQNQATGTGTEREKRCSGCLVSDR